MRVEDIPIHDHHRNGHESFRTSVIKRIKRQVGGFALVDTDIAFESPVTGPAPSREALQRELAEFRETEQSLGLSN